VIEKMSSQPFYSLRREPLPPTVYFADQEADIASTVPLRYGPELDVSNMPLTILQKDTKQQDVRARIDIVDPSRELVD